MSAAKYKMELTWKSFNVNLASCEIQFKVLGGEHCCGIQAHNFLELWFLEEPTQEEKDAILTYWESITETSAEATSYQSKDDIETARLVKVASAKAKLAALGLTEDELKALLG
jgi:hypothetical protein